MFNHISQTQKNRTESYFYELRRFHNSIKRQLYDTYTKNIDNLLEIAAGKGGDLNKWSSNKIKNVVGYDIDNASIEEGIRRVKSNKGYTPKVELNVLDLSRNVIKPSVPFDVVSAMFCFHYFFESKETFNTILSSIKSNLKSGGIFMGTMFDGESLLGLLGDESVFELSDQGEVRFRLEFFNRNKSAFGNKVAVFMKDTVLDSPMNEYIVNFDSFVELMKENGFELIETKMFNEFNSNTYKLNNVSKKVSFLNRTFVFRKLDVKLPLICKEENEYLVECGWTSNYKEILIEKYKESLTNKIKESKNEKAISDYKYIRENLRDDISDVLSDKDVSKSVKEYISKIHEMYKESLKMI